jgi:hypothetical protein
MIWRRSRKLGRPCARSTRETGSAGCLRVIEPISGERDQEEENHHQGDPDRLKRTYRAFQYNHSDNPLSVTTATDPAVVRRDARADTSYRRLSSLEHGADVATGNANITPSNILECMPPRTNRNVC